MITPFSVGEGAGSYIFGCLRCETNYLNDKMNLGSALTSQNSAESTQSPTGSFASRKSVHSKVTSLKSAFHMLFMLSHSLFARIMQPNKRTPVARTGSQPLIYAPNEAFHVNQRHDYDLRRLDGMPRGPSHTCWICASHD